MSGRQISVKETAIFGAHLLMALKVSARTDCNFFWCLPVADAKVSAGTGSFICCPPIAGVKLHAQIGGWYFVGAHLLLEGRYMPRQTAIFDAHL